MRFAKAFREGMKNPNPIAFAVGKIAAHVANGFLLGIGIMAAFWLFGR